MSSWIQAKSVKYIEILSQCSSDSAFTITIQMDEQTSKTMSAVKQMFNSIQYSKKWWLWTYNMKLHQSCTCKADTILRVSCTSFSNVSLIESSHASSTASWEDSATCTQMYKHITQGYTWERNIVRFTEYNMCCLAELTTVLLMLLSVRVAACWSSRWRQWTDRAEAHGGQNTN